MNSSFFLLPIDTFFVCVYSFNMLQADNCIVIPSNMEDFHLQKYVNKYLKCLTVSRNYIILRQFLLKSGKNTWSYFPTYVHVNLWSHSSIDILCVWGLSSGLNPSFNSLYVRSKAYHLMKTRLTSFDCIWPAERHKLLLMHLSPWHPKEGTVNSRILMNIFFSPHMILIVRIFFTLIW